MRHVVLVAFFFPPSRSSGVHRALAMANYLASLDVRVTVVTTSVSFFELESGPADYSQMVAIDDAVEVVRVPFASRPIHTDLSLISRWYWRLHPLLARLARNRRLSKVLAALSLRTAGGFSPKGVDERYRHWFSPAVSRACEIDGIENADLIVATGNPFTSFLIAEALSDLTGVPYLVDYRDPWKIDVRTGLPRRRSATTEQVEQRVLSKARAVTFPNEFLRLEYERFFPETSGKSFVVENGFDAGSVAWIDETYQSEPSAERVLRFGALGTVSDMWPLAEFTEAWSRFHGTTPGAEFELRGHLGWFNSNEQQLAGVIDALGEAASYGGPVEKAEVAAFYGSLDVIVVFLWGGPGLTAGKMYEVAAQGKPIVCIQPAGGGVRAFFEREHPLAFCADPEPASIAAALSDAAAAARQWSPTQAKTVQDSFLDYERSRLLQPLGDFVLQLYDERSGNDA